MKAIWKGAQMERSEAKPAPWSAERAAAFQSRSVVDRYHLRPPYPQAVIDTLAGLVVDSPLAVPDVGTGTGELARRLTPAVERIDAVDLSPAMIARGRTLPGGNDPRLRWILGPIEDAPLDPPYALIMGGSSLHWPDWDVAIPRFATLLSPRGMLAIIHRRLVGAPWQEELRALERRYAPEREQPRPHMVEELERRGPFRETGRREVDPEPFAQSVEDYIQAIHSPSTFSLERMRPEEAAALDGEVRELVRPWSGDGMLQLAVAGSVVWGRPGSTQA
jgi:SAM-dependent methyltransferase